MDKLRRHFEAQGLEVTLIETHISWVLLVGDFAYKLKKPVRQSFLDYSTLAARHHCCQEELRLNRRLAPDLYLSVHAVREVAEGRCVLDDLALEPGVSLDTTVIDVALKMRRLPPQAMASEQLARGTLTREHLQRLAQRLADFQHHAPVAWPDSPYGQPVFMREQPLRTSDALAAFVPLGTTVPLRAWLTMQADALMPLWGERRAAGHVREGHGDLHLDNVVVLNGGGCVTAFDGIEFDPMLRWIDTAADIGFLVMDLLAHRRRDLAFAFLDAYLQASGDYGALPMLQHVMVYRASVRALVSGLRAQAGVPTAGLGVMDYVACAQALTQPFDRVLFITHGLPGSGKTFVSQRVLESVGAVRVRSDVERKRLAGLGPLDDSRAIPNLDLYTPAHTDATFARLEALADGALQAGYPVVVDAAFLRRAQRDRFQALAARHGVRFTILDCTAPMAVLRERLCQRQGRGGDASEADASVLTQLAALAEPLGDDERARVETGAGTTVGLPR